MNATSLDGRLAATTTVNTTALTPDHVQNHPENASGTSYCTNSPDYDCYSSGWPACCNEPGGDFYNCPQEQPDCDPGDVKSLAFAAATFLRGKN